MAELNFGGVIETVMTREEFPLEKAREILKNHCGFGLWRTRPRASMQLA